MSATTQIQPAGKKEMRRILGSSFLGTAIEYYDFILYATAASIVFNKVFFADLPPAVGTFVAFATLAVGYVARPLGGIIFGHFGDRVGRKAMLVATLLLMGAASVAIGLIPTPAQIGIAAPILLVILRAVQGIAVGGEWGGAMLLGFEHAKKEKRGFAAAVAYMGAPAGTILATLVLSASSMLPSDQFVAWGWRIPFLLSAALVAVGLLIRLRVSESPAFKALQNKPKPARTPAVEVLTKHPRSLAMAVVTGIAGQAAQGLMGAWALSFAVQQATLAPTSVLNVKALAGFCTIVAIIVAARLSDRFGRREMMLVGTIGAMVLAFPVMWLLDTGTVWGLFAALVLGLSLVQGFSAGPYGAYAAELFPTAVRYSGTSIGYQTAATLGAGFTPMIATALVIAADGALWMVALTWIVMSGISTLALLLGKTRRASKTPAPACVATHRVASPAAHR